MFPILHYEGQDLPQKGTYFVVADNGIFIHKEHAVATGTGRIVISSALLPVDKISFLDSLKTDKTVYYHLPPVSKDVVAQLKYFFGIVVDKYHSEAASILYFHTENKEWKVDITKQVVSHGGVGYDQKHSRQTYSAKGGVANPRWVSVGTIHSHCDFGSFHSGTDVDDEEHFDGLHVTFGNNDRDEFSITSSIVVNGHRLEIDPMKVLDGIQHLGGKMYRLADPPEIDEGLISGWLENVRPRAEGRGSFQLSDLFKTKRKQTDSIEPKCWVRWKNEETKNWFLRKKIGEGPFQVLTNRGGLVELETKIGKVSVSSQWIQRG